MFTQHLFSVGAIVPKPVFVRGQQDSWLTLVLFSAFTQLGSHFSHELGENCGQHAPFEAEIKRYKEKTLFSILCPSFWLLFGFVVSPQSQYVKGLISTHCYWEVMGTLRGEADRDTKLLEVFPQRGLWYSGLFISFIYTATVSAVTMKRCHRP